MTERRFRTPWLSLVLGSMLILAMTHSLANRPNVFNSALALSDHSGPRLLSAPIIMDSSFSQLTEGLVGQQAILSTIVADSVDDIEYLSLIEVRNETGITILLESRWDKLDPGRETEIHHLWRPETTGTFEVRSFLISAECVPEILTPVNAREVVVKAPDGSQTLTPLLEDLAPEELQQLTREEIQAIEHEENIRSNIDSEASDAEDRRLEAKERRIRELIWSDDRIKEYQETFAVFGYDSHFAMDEQGLCDNAEMTIHVARDRHVEGEWQTSYLITLSGRLELTVSVVDGAILSIVENPLNDTRGERIYTDEEKQAIRIAVNNETVKALFQGREIEIGVVRVSKVFFNGCEQCALVVIHLREDRERSTTVRVDVSSERVVSFSQL